uniref:FYVE-type domain-containing protein n=1 Tax=Peronospora matthiolae TaxID=2874970 RepID=A0AAV1U3N9_9STRA
MPKIDLNEVELPALTLTLERKLVLLAELDALVESTLELRSAFAAGGHQLDTSAWKLVKTVDDVRAYRSRRALHGVSDQTGDTCEMDSYASSSRSSSQGSMRTRDKTSSLGSSTSSSGEGRGHQKVPKKTARPPAVVISGIIDGTAEDAMLGIISDTEVKFKIRQAYLKTELDDARTLAALVLPTRENPFAYAAVKWGLEPYSHFSQARDFVFLEAAGLTTDSKGEVVAYAVRQSVDLSDILDLVRLPNVIRGYMSGCQTFGNMTPLGDTGHPTVEVFSRAFIEMDGSVPVNMAAAAYAEKLMALALCMECAYTHKLAYLMRQGTERGRQGSSRQITSSSNCTNCTRVVCRDFFFLQLQRGGCCRICQRTFCGRCSVTRKMYVSLGNEVLQKSMLFCLECLLEAKSIDARIVASDKIHW